MFRVRLITEPAELQAVFALRYSIYIEEMGKTFLQHDEEEKMIREPADAQAFHIGLFLEESLVGFVRLHYPPAGDEELNRLSIPLSLQQRYRLSVSSRLMIRKEYRGTRAMWPLMAFTFDKNIRDGIDFGLIEVEPSLASLYQKFGFHILGMHINEYGMERIILFINGRDVEHFRRIKSPLAGIFEKMITDMNTDMAAVQHQLITSFKTIV